MIKNKITFINASPAPAHKNTNYLLWYHPETIRHLSKIQKYVNITAESVGDLIAQNVTTNEWNNIYLGKYSTISFVIDCSLDYSNFLTSCTSSSVNSYSPILIIYANLPLCWGPCGFLALAFFYSSYFTSSCWFYYAAAFYGKALYYLGAISLISSII